MEELKDIKPYMQSSEILYWSLIVVVGLLLLSILVWVVMFAIRVIKNKKINIRKEYMSKLRAIEWSSPKQSAYDISKYGRLLATDTRSKEIFSQLEPMLVKYKYKKDVESVDVDTINHYNLFVQVLDGTI